MHGRKRMLPKRQVRLLSNRCNKNGWRVAFFEGPTGAPRTGIIDAICYRLGRRSSDLLEIRLVQLKGGNAGVTGREVARLKAAAANDKVDWLIAELDQGDLHFLADGSVPNHADLTEVA